MSEDARMPGRSPAKPSGSLVRRDMRIADIVAALPEAQSLLERYGLSCVSCALSPLETIEEGCRLHGFEDGDIDDLVNDLNLLLTERPERPAVLTLTRTASQMLKGIMETEGKTGWVLSVCIDETGGFCMEFMQHPAQDDRLFFHDELPDVRIAASPLTLAGIGGATIDVRDGRFKLDLSEDTCTGDGNCGHCTCGEKE